jgi:hypothetical protein
MESKLNMKLEERIMTLRDTKQMFNIIGNDKTFTLLTSNMPERLKQILQMSWKYCMSHKQIAEYFGISTARVKQLYERGVRRFKININKAIDEYEQMKIFFDDMENLKYENKELKEENQMFKRRFDALTTEDKLICGQVDVLKEKIINFDFDVRSINALRGADVYTMEELVQFSRNDLMKFRNLGKGSIDKIEELLKKYNLKLNTKNTFKFGIFN